VIAVAGSLPGVEIELQQIFERFDFGPKALAHARILFRRKPRKFGSTAEAKFPYASAGQQVARSIGAIAFKKNAQMARVLRKFVVPRQARK